MSEANFLPSPLVDRLQELAVGAFHRDGEFLWRRDAFGNLFLFPLLPLPVDELAGRLMRAQVRSADRWSDIQVCVNARDHVCLARRRGATGDPLDVQRSALQMIELARQIRSAR